MGLEVTETFKVTEAGLDEFTITSRLMRKARLSTAECAVVRWTISWKWR